VPFWDLLRGDPVVGKIVVSFALKETRRHNLLRNLAPGFPLYIGERLKKSLAKRLFQPARKKRKEIK